MGTYNANPLVNSQIYEVMFPDGSVQQFAANSQVDRDGHRYDLLEAISGHRKDGTAVSKEDGWILTSRGGNHTG